MSTIGELGLSILVAWAASIAFWCAATWHIVRHADQRRLCMTLAATLGPIGYLVAARGSGLGTEREGGVGSLDDAEPVDWSTL